MYLIHQIDEMTHNKGDHCHSEKAKSMVSKFEDVFQGLGLIKTNAIIHIDPTIPAVIDPPRRIAYAIQNKVHKELKCMLVLGIIAEQHDPTSWVNSITIIQKPHKLVYA